jgi:hypothetical protein
MFRFASSLLASAALVFLGTSMLGTALADSRTFPPPRHIITRPFPPKVIATVVAHRSDHASGWVSVHGL